MRKSPGKFHQEDPDGSQRIVIVDDFSERTPLLARALCDNGYGVVTVRAHSDEELQASVCRLRPDFAVIGDDVIIDLAEGDHWPPAEVRVAC